MVESIGVLSGTVETNRKKNTIDLGRLEYIFIMSSHSVLSFPYIFGKYFSRHSFPRMYRMHGTTQSAWFKKASALFPQPRSRMQYKIGPRSGISDLPIHLVTVTGARAEAETSVKESTR